MVRMTCLSTYVNNNHVCTLPKYTFSDQPFPWLLTYCHGSHFLPIHNYITFRQGHILFLFTAQLIWKERKGWTVGMLRMFLYNWVSVFVLGHTRFSSVSSFQKCFLMDVCLSLLLTWKIQSTDIFWTNQLTMEWNSRLLELLLFFLVNLSFLPLRTN